MAVILRTDQSITVTSNTLCCIQNLSIVDLCLTDLTDYMAVKNRWADMAQRGTHSQGDIWVLDVVLLITKRISYKDTRTLLGVMTDRATNTTLRDWGWVEEGGGVSIPVPCQAAGGSRGKRLRQCDWASVTLRRSILTFLLWQHSQCEGNSSHLNWHPTIWCISLVPGRGARDDQVISVHMEGAMNWDDDSDWK